MYVCYLLVPGGMCLLHSTAVKREAILVYIYI